MKKKNCCHRITNFLLLVLCMVAFLTACTSESKKEDQRDIEVRSGHTFDLSKTYSIGILLPDGEIALEYAELIMCSRLQAIPDSSYPDGENRYKKLSPKA